MREDDNKFIIRILNLLPATTYNCVSSVINTFGESAASKELQLTTEEEGERYLFNF